MGQTKEEFIKNNAQPKITVERLDEIFSWAMEPKRGRIAWIVNVIKLASVCAYLYCRYRLLEDTWHISKQNYEREQISDNKKEVNSHG